MVGSQAVQALAERHDKAYQRFFAYKPGGGVATWSPRFKKVKLYSSFTRKQAGWTYAGDHRSLIHGVVYTFSLSRPLEGNTKTVTVKRDAPGHLWICLPVVQDALEPSEANTGNIGGFDVGSKACLTDHEGNEYPSLQFLKAELKEAAGLNRALSGKEKGSNHGQKAQRRRAKAQARMTNKRRAAHRKLAHELCTRFDLACLETLNLGGVKRLWGARSPTWALLSWSASCIR